MNFEMKLPSKTQGAINSVKEIYNEIPWKTFFKELWREINDDDILNGAAALAYFLLLSIFPALIFLLSLLPFLPIDELRPAILDFIYQSFPGETAKLVQKVVDEVLLVERGGLLSIGILLTIWAASNGIYVIMQHLNITYDVKETRPFWKVRGTSIALMFAFLILMLVAFTLIVFGGRMQGFIDNYIPIDWHDLFHIGFTIARWFIIVLFLMIVFALTYYYGPDVKQEFKFITPGSLLGLILLIIASLGFRYYIDNFGDYSASYGSLGTVIILMLWLYIVGVIFLLGSEVNALIEHYHEEGKNKGERKKS